MIGRGYTCRAALLVLLAGFVPCAIAETAPADQAAQYQAEVRKTILELQQFRTVESTEIRSADGRAGRATLVNLNPRINGWYLLAVDWEGRGGQAAYHLENPKPAEQVFHLSSAGLSASPGADCDLWGGGPALEDARRSAIAYAPLCGGRLYLRNRVPGHFSGMELTTDFLRKYVWGGDQVISAVRETFYADRFIERGMPGAAQPAAAAPGPSDAGPLPAALGALDHSIVPGDVGIAVARPARDLVQGQWYAASGASGIYLSFVQPKSVAPEILASDRDHVNPLDPVEAGALSYLVAFDLADFDVGFALGTDHPRVDWSDRPAAALRGELPGPDGIGASTPLVTNGLLSPVLAARTAATFTGGFKREHGAFKYGDFSAVNHGSHYGFVEQGVVFSKLQPGLATLYGLDDGTVGLKSWTAGDDALLPRLRFARQNGVPLVEYDRTSGRAAAGALVNRWGPGNWSGTADEKLRSVRAGVCLQETPSRRFLIYGYFSSATPSAMARVFQAYRCRYAMHLDMNALEHTYLAIFPQGLPPQHLVQGMAQLEQKSGAGTALRFIGYPDNRDFFYLTRKEAGR